jgi:hypothetical protein
MAIAEYIAGTEAVSSTEHSCILDGPAGFVYATDDGVYQLVLDLSDMIIGDVLRVRLMESVDGNELPRVGVEWIFRDTQTEKIFTSPTFILMHQWDFTLYAIAGTITVNWSIRQVA